ncbi:MAG: aspartyl protease family protein, partial [Planctomycetes bacterium]|nr:aspartyl protease family protein [Planctomycetota bacterium]
ASIVRAAEEIRRLEEAVADRSDVAAFLDAEERLPWVGIGGSAEGEVQALLAVVPDHPRALALLAAVRFEQGLREEALPFAEAALRGTPGEPLALVYRAVVRAAEGNLEEALADLGRAEAAAPQRPEPAHFLGSLLFYRGRFAEAAERLERVPPHEPDAEGRVPFVRLVLAYRDLFEGRRPFAVPARFAPVEVGIESRPDLPAVAVVVNGRRRGWMQIDTGSETTRIPRREAALAEVREDAVVRTGAVDSTTPLHAPGRVDSIEIGGLLVRDVPALVEMEEHAPPAEGVLGALGTDFIARFDPTINLLSRRLLLAPAGSGIGGYSGDIGVGAEQLGALRFTRVGNTLRVRASLGEGPPLEFVLDTGAAANTLDSAILRERFGVTEGDPRTTPVAAKGIAGRPFRTFSFPLPVPLVVDGTPLHGLAVLAEDRLGANLRGRTRTAGTLGLPLLSSMSLSIDFGKQEINYFLRGSPARGR